MCALQKMITVKLTTSIKQSYRPSCWVRFDLSAASDQLTEVHYLNKMFYVLDQRGSRQPRSQQVKQQQQQLQTPKQKREFMFLFLLFFITAAILQYFTSFASVLEQLSRQQRSQQVQQQQKLQIPKQKREFTLFAL